MSDHFPEQPSGAEPEPEPEAKPHPGDTPEARAALAAAQAGIDAVGASIQEREARAEREFERLIDLAIDRYDAGAHPGELAAALEEVAGPEAAATFAQHWQDQERGFEPSVPETPEEWWQAKTQEAEIQSAILEATTRAEQDEQAQKLRQAAVEAVERAQQAVPGGDLAQALELLDQGGAGVTDDPEALGRMVETGLRGSAEIQRATAQARQDALDEFELGATPLHDPTQDFHSAEAYEAAKESWLDKKTQQRLAFHLQSENLKAPKPAEEIQREEQDAYLEPMRSNEEWERAVERGSSQGETLQEADRKAREAVGTNLEGFETTVSDRGERLEGATRAVRGDREDVARVEETVGAESPFPSWWGSAGWGS